MHTIRAEPLQSRAFRYAAGGAYDSDSESDSDESDDIPLRTLQAQRLADMGILRQQQRGQKTGDASLIEGGDGVEGSPLDNDLNGQESAAEGREDPNAGASMEEALQGLRSLSCTPAPDRDPRSGTPAHRNVSHDAKVSDEETIQPAPTASAVAPGTGVDQADKPAFFFILAHLVEWEITRRKNGTEALVFKDGLYGKLGQIQHSPPRIPGQPERYDADWPSGVHGMWRRYAAHFRRDCPKLTLLLGARSGAVTGAGAGVKVGKAKKQEAMRVEVSKQGEGAAQGHKKRRRSKKEREERALWAAMSPGEAIGTLIDSPRHL